MSKTGGPAVGDMSMTDRRQLFYFTSGAFPCIIAAKKFLRPAAAGRGRRHPRQIHLPGAASQSEEKKEIRYGVYTRRSV